MVTRPSTPTDSARISAIWCPLPELTVFGMMLGSGKEYVHFMRATRSLTSALFVAEAAVEHSST